MTENTNTTTTNTKPTENTFGKAFKNVLLFPFRVAGFALKAVLIAFLVILALGLIRAAFPMNLPEAQGMTYYELMADRWEAEKRGRSDLEFSPAFINIVMYPGILYNTAYPAVMTVLNPGGKHDKWLKSSNRFYTFALPRGDAKISNLPSLVWEAIERSTWYWFVLTESQLPLPQPKNQ